MSKVETIAVEAKSDDPQIQAALDEAKSDLQDLTPMLNRKLESISAGGIKRIVKGLVTFQDVKYQGDEFETQALIEHLLKSKLTIMLTAARSEQVKTAQEKRAQEKEETSTNG